MPPLAACVHENAVVPRLLELSMSWKDTASVSLRGRADLEGHDAAEPPAMPSSRLMPLNCTELR